jgi:hypothetical protein
MVATGGIVRQIIVRRMLRITARATIARLTDQTTGPGTGREIVPVATGRQINLTGPAHRAGQGRNRFDRIAHRSRPGRIAQIRAGQRNLVRRGLHLSQGRRVRAVHKRSRGSVSNQDRNPDRRNVSAKRGTSSRAFAARIFDGSLRVEQRFSAALRVASLSGFSR